ncbi:MAG: hypothetical protein UR26_C0002G0086 [candidate division TM6 bacterium GW2011_GWF2_32_72]|nr:MAG: hypothetical protein UR26_C0002G0086 [candidate division TM6 bacterium GW2011_GWF2_32_72]
MNKKMTLLIISLITTVYTQPRGYHGGYHHHGGGGGDFAGGALFGTAVGLGLGAATAPKGPGKSYTTTSLEKQLRDSGKQLQRIQKRNDDWRKKTNRLREKISKKRARHS